MHPLLQALLLYLLIVNVFTFLLFGWDKFNARTHDWRISERRLWFFTLIGGSVGALAGMNLFRHKTQKDSFQLVIALIFLLHVGIVVLVLREIW